MNDKEYVRLQTITRCDKPNLNGIIYTKDAMEKAIKNIKDNNIPIYLADEGYKQRDGVNIEEISTILPQNILGRITNPEDLGTGSINVELLPGKKELLDKYLENGYAPGMRYTAEVKNVDGVTYAENISKIIALDMIKIPKSKES